MNDRSQSAEDKNDLELFAEQFDDLDLQVEPLPGEAAYGTFACFGTAATAGGTASTAGSLSSTS